MPAAEVEACLSLVRRELIVPGSPDDAACLVIGGKLYSVWATEDSKIAFDHNVTGRRGQVQSQGGFPQQRKGRVYIVGVDHGAYHEWTRIERVCRWCRGTGEHPFLPERWSQVLHHGWPLGMHGTAQIRHYSFVAPAHEQVLSREMEGPRRVSAWRSRPLTAMLASFERQGISLLDKLGLEFEDAACPRCSGSGDLAGVPGRVLQSA